MISIIIPVYNAKEFLKCSVDSVLNQSYTDIELLLIDDGSTDGSGDICDQYASAFDKIKVFHKRNGGVSSARNTGLEYSTGEYVMFLDSDDMMETEICSLMLETMQAREADIVICGTKETGGSIWAPLENTDFSLQELKNNGSYLIRTELLSPPWNKLYKRSLIKTRFDERTSFGEDLIFNLAYLKECKKISFIPDTPFFHTKDNCESLSRKVYPRRLNEIELYRTALADFFPSCNSAVNQKYIHDLSVYSRLLFKTNERGIDAIVPGLNEWREHTALSRSMILKSSESESSKLILMGMSYGWWTFVMFLLNTAAFARKKDRE